MQVCFRGSGGTQGVLARLTETQLTRGDREDNGLYAEVTSTPTESKLATGSGSKGALALQAADKLGIRLLAEFVPATESLTSVGLENRP